ncbi:MAG: hypothetical protein JNK85_18655 [Verrucomicrobiales bacterium]|nr:hypothetical protein [Verrucomicrobiales bacterium]
MIPDSAPLAITGLGVWCAAGTSPEELHHNALRGLPRATFGVSERPAIAVCQAPTPERSTHFPQIHRMDRSAQLALAAAHHAFHQARLADIDPTRIAILVGNSRGPAGLWTEPPTTRLRPTRAAHSAVASISGALSLALRVRGPCLTLSATCASAAHAIAMAACMIRGGIADAVIAGGAEAPLAPGLLDQFTAAGIVGHGPTAADACRPFDQHRNGTVPGEGAAFLVLESEANARRRGATIAARLAGAAMAAESHNRVAARPDGDGLVRAMQLALAEARLEPEAIGYVNAHGTGTRVNDAAEAAALRRVFGTCTDTLPVSSTKAVTGHSFGAVAAVEAVIAIQTLRARLAPPSAACVHLDPTLGIRVLIDQPAPLLSPAVMSNSLGFWGNTASLIFIPAGE